MNRYSFVSCLAVIACASFAACKKSSTDLDRPSALPPRTLVVTPDSCAKWNMPAVSFRVSWPEDVKVVLPRSGALNENYAEFVYKKDTLFYESLSIGHLEGGAVEALGGVLLDQMESGLRAQYSEMETVYKGRKRWLDRDIFQLQVILYVKDKTQGDPGRYRLFVGLVPPPSGSPNGVLVIFQSEERCEDISDFADFGVQGKTGEVWKTFTYNHR